MNERPPIGGVALLPNDPSFREARDARRTGRRAHEEFRTHSQKDVDRLLYARSFLRLGAVTQVSTPDPLRPVIHNRLTHTLKVAQIARTIAGNLICSAAEDNPRATAQRELILVLGGLDSSVAEAAALAHDIGHPPYGHAGETVLDRYVRAPGSDLRIPDGFEGNAQSFRFAVKSDPMYDLGVGLDLTQATAAAVLKYPWPRPTSEIPVPEGTPSHQAKLRERKFGYYHTEAAQFAEVRSWLNSAFNDPARPRQTLEASVMDIADDITYAVHDYEDFLTMGVLSRDTVQADLEELAGLGGVDQRSNRAAVTALVAQVREFDRFDLALLQSVAAEHLASLPSLFLSPYNREFRNGLLDKLLGTDCILVTEEPQHDVGAHVSLAPEPWHLVELLKFFVKHYVINSPGLALLQAGQGALLRKGVARFVKWHDEDPDRLPGDLKTRLVWAAGHGEPLARAYLDYVCTFGDDQWEAVTLALSGERTAKLVDRSPVN